MEGYHVAAIRYLVAQALRYRQGAEGRDAGDQDATGESICLILDQDIANMTQVQAGMKSSMFQRARPNPVQEVELINFHRTLEQYVLGQARG